MLKPKSMSCDIIYGMRFRLLAKDCVRKRIGQRPFSMLDMFKEVTFPQVKIHAKIQKNKYNAFISNFGFSFSTELNASKCMTKSHNSCAIFSRLSGCIAFKHSLTKAHPLTAGIHPASHFGTDSK